VASADNLVTIENPSHDRRRGKKGYGARRVFKVGWQGGQDLQEVDKKQGTMVIRFGELVIRQRNEAEDVKQIRHRKGFIVDTTPKKGKK